MVRPAGMKNRVTVWAWTKPPLAVRNTENGSGQIRPCDDPHALLTIGDRFLTSLLALP